MVINSYSEFASVFLFSALVGCQSNPPSEMMPSVFSAGLIYAVPVTTSGDTLRFLVDTAGATFIYDRVAERYADATNSSLPPGVAHLPQFTTKYSLPSPSTPGGVLPLRVAETADFRGDRDGMLGIAWFSQRVWTLDYKRKHLLLHSDDSEAEGILDRTAEATRFDVGGQYSIPVLEVVVDGTPHRMILDTGATLVLSDEARLELDDGLPARRGVCVAVFFNRSRLYERAGLLHG